MLETFTGLLAAHVLADFALQTRWITTHKRHWRPFTLHILTVWAVTALVLGQPHSLEIAMLALAHGFIDYVKTRHLSPTLASFVGDQFAHLLTLAVVTLAAPHLWETGFWVISGFNATWVPASLALLAGALLATRAAGFAVALLLPPENPSADGIPEARALIGLLERGLIFALVLIGQPAGIGFLVTAKSILRFEASGAGPKAEYVIIGTLASFGLALVLSTITVMLARALAPDLIDLFRST